MKFITSRASSDSPLFLVLSLVLSIIHFPCGVRLLIKGNLYLMISACLSKEKPGIIMMQDWRLYTMALSVGFGGWLLGYFAPKLGMAFIGLSSGWAIADIFALFIGNPYIELAISSILSIIAMIILFVRPRWLHIYITWMGAHLLIGSPKLLVMGILVYDSKYRAVEDIELYSLQAGCIVAMIIVFICNLIGSDESEPINEKLTV